MKRKTNIHIRNNKGIYVTSNLILGSGDQYVSGDILDANKVQEKINDSISQYKVTGIKLADGTTYNQQELITHGTVKFTDINGATIYMSDDTPVTNVLVYYDYHEDKIRNAVFVQNGNELTITTDNWGFEVKNIIVMSERSTAELYFAW